MRLYHYMPSAYGLEDLRRSRIKIARLAELNDPFELWGCWQNDKALRSRIAAWKSKMAQAFGMVCLSEDWKNPLLWSHYADRHKGLCLGFDIPDEKVKKVSYTDKRIKLRSNPSEAEFQSLLYSKYMGWSYEREWRLWVALEEMKDGNYFLEFGDEVRLREVYVGPFCEISRQEVDDALSNGKQAAYVIKTRLAYKSFSVVENRNFRNKDWA